MDNDRLKNQFGFDFNGHTNVFAHYNLIAIVIFLVGITDWLTLYIHAGMQALIFSRMYIQGATAQFGTACSHTPAESAADGLCVEEELWVLDCQIFCLGICICSIM